jgi:hypothetical protein
MLRNLMFFPRNSKSSIPTQDLVFHFDPSNSQSYPGSGNVLFDLSGNNNHLSTTNFNLNSYYDGKSFNIDQGRTLSGVISNGMAYTTSITISAWVKGSAIIRQNPCALFGSGGTLYFNLNDADSGSLYRTVWFYWNSNGAPLCALTINALGANALNPGHSDLLNGAWQSIIFRRNMANSPYTDIFVNGVKMSSGNPGLQRLFDQTGAGGWSPGSQWYYGFGNTFQGNIGSTWMYKAALLDDQIIENFNSEKSKYL